MARGVKGSGNIANLTSPEARAKASERMKANRPRMVLRRLMKSIAAADVSAIEAEIARLKAEVAALEKMRDTINGLKGGNCHAAPAGPMTASPAERIANYLLAAGEAKPATIAADLGMITSHVESLLAERDHLFQRTVGGWKRKDRK